jgi:hypothetical protein
MPPFMQGDETQKDGGIAHVDPEKPLAHTQRSTRHAAPLRQGDDAQKLAAIAGPGQASTQHASTASTAANGLDMALRGRPAPIEQRRYLIRYRREANTHRGAALGNVKHSEARVGGEKGETEHRTTGKR